MAPLRTCRQIYREAIEILYTENTFAFCGLSAPAVLSSFSQTITSQRLKSIRSLYVNVNANEFELYEIGSIPHVAHFEPQWVRMWETIVGKMSGLRHVSIKLGRIGSVDEPNVKLSLDGNWVKPLLGLRDLDTFLLVIYRVNTSFGCGPEWFPAEYTDDVCSFQDALRSRICSQPQRCSDELHHRSAELASTRFHEVPENYAVCGMCGVAVEREYRIPLEWRMHPRAYPPESFRISSDEYVE